MTLPEDDSTRLEWNLSGRIRRFDRYISLTDGAPNL